MAIASGFRTFSVFNAYEQHKESKKVQYDQTESSNRVTYAEVAVATGQMYLTASRHEAA